VAEFPTIDGLPEHFGRLAAGFRTGAAQLVRNAAPGWVSARPPQPDMLLLRTALIRTRFSLVSQDNEVVMFVFHKDSQPREVLRASIEFLIAPVVFPGRPLRMLPEAIAHFVVVPPFLRAVPHVNPIDISGFLALAREIGEWVSQDFDRGEAIPLDASLLANTPVLSKTFHHICEAWSEAYNQATQSPFRPDSPLLSTLPDFEVQGYRASVLLRMRGGRRRA
jgi:hypothetical protein